MWGSWSGKNSAVSDANRGNALSPITEDTNLKECKDLCNQNAQCKTIQHCVHPNSEDKYEHIYFDSCELFDGQLTRKMRTYPNEYCSDHYKAFNHHPNPDSHRKYRGKYDILHLIISFLTNSTFNYYN